LKREALRLPTKRVESKAPNPKHTQVGLFDKATVESLLGDDPDGQRGRDAFVLRWESRQMMLGRVRRSDDAVW
jgi:hypothetical protein